MQLHHPQNRYQLHEVHQVYFRVAQILSTLLALLWLSYYLLHYYNPYQQTFDNRPSTETYIYL